METCILLLIALFVLGFQLILSVKKTKTMTTPTPSKLSEDDLATLSRFDYVSEESLAALSQLDARTRTMIIQSCAANPNFDDVDLYYLAMSELSDLQAEAEAATTVAANAHHQDVGESVINVEPPMAATATSNNWVTKGKRSNNGIRTVVTFPVAMKDHHQKKPVHSDGDTLQRPPFNANETQASFSCSISPTMPTLFDHVCHKLQNLVIDTDRERATKTIMIAKRTTKERDTTNDKGKAKGRRGPSTSSTADERMESQRSITALKLTKLVAVTESPPPPPSDQVCHNQDSTSAIVNECVKTVITKTRTRVCLKKTAIDFEYQEENSSTIAKKMIIKLKTATEVPPTTPVPPKVCSHQETALAITDDECLVVKKVERAYGTKRAVDFEYKDEEDLYKASTSSKKRMIKKKNTLENNIVQLPQPPPDLPAELRERIVALQGTDPVLVIQKALYSTDVNPVQCRLSLPLTKVNPEFLSPEETATLSTRRGSEVPEMKVQLIEPSGHVREMSLKKWDMKKGSGTVNSTYNLVSGWKNVVRDNDLQAAMIIQLWSFQVGTQRWFALVKVESDEGH